MGEASPTVGFRPHTRSTLSHPPEAGFGQHQHEDDDEDEADVEWSTPVEWGMAGGISIPVLSLDPGVADSADSAPQWGSGAGNGISVEDPGSTGWANGGANSRSVRGAGRDNSQDPGDKGGVIVVGKEATYKELLCPITLQLPTDPVTASDGRVYEREAMGRARGWVRSPTCRGVG